MPRRSAEARRRAHQRLNQRGRELREALVRELGGKCEGCGGTLMSVLEIDHVDGRSWSPRRFSQLSRAKRYWEEYRAGVRLRVLCRRCNAVDGALRGNTHIPDPPKYQLPEVYEEPVPF